MTPNIQCSVQEMHMINIQYRQSIWKAFCGNGYYCCNTNWYLVGFNDGLNFCILELLFGSIEVFGLVYMWIHGSININDSIKEPFLGYQNCSTCQIMVFGGYVIVREFFYTQVVIHVNIHSKAYSYKDNFCLGLKILACCLGTNLKYRKMTLPYLHIK